MPDFLDDEHAAMLSTAEELAERLAALAAESSGDDGGDLSARVREASKAAGVFGMTQPADFGGSEAGALALTITRDALGSRNVAHLPGIFGPSPGVLAGVDEPLRSRFLLPYLAGELRAGFGFTEPADAPRHTWAALDGAGDLIVNGAKSYVTGGADADFINTLVEVVGTGPAMLLIETDRHGVTLERRFGTLDGSHHAAFRFTDVRVPGNHLLGEAGRGLGRAMEQINATRMAIAAACMGECRFVIGLVETHLKVGAGGDPQQKPGSPLERATLGQMRIDAYGARSALYRTARLMDAGRNAVNEVMAAKSLATETLSQICDEAVQLVGGTALVEGHPLEGILRRVRALRLAEGPTEVLAANVARGSLDLGLGRI